MRESAAAIRAFADYLSMGGGRSLHKLADRYQTYTDHAPPTQHLRVLKEWSRKHQWQQRVGEHERAIALEDARREREARLDQLRRMREWRLAVVLEVTRMALEALRRAAARDAISASVAVQMLRYADESQRRDEAAIFAEWLATNARSNGRVFTVGDTDNTLVFTVGDDESAYNPSTNRVQIPARSSRPDVAVLSSPAKNRTLTP